MEEQQHFTPEEIDLYLVSRALWDIEEKCRVSVGEEAEFYELERRIGERARARHRHDSPSVRQIMDHLKRKCGV